MTGPLAFLTTLRLSDIDDVAAAAGGAPGAADTTVSFGGSTAQPVITLTAPKTALRIRKARRSVPAGSSVVSSSGSGLDVIALGSTICRD